MNQNIIDFLGKKLVPVKVINQSQKAERNGLSTTSTFEFPEYILLTEVRKSGNLFRIMFFDGSCENEAYVKEDFKVGKLPKSKIKDLLEDFNSYVVFNRGFYFESSMGSDPEIFVEDDKGIVIPAFNFLGSKKKPSIPSKDNNQERLSGHPVYWDGFQAEFETTPDNCLGWHVDTVRHGLKSVYDFAKKHNPNAKLSIKTVMNIPPDVLANAEPEHVAFGCMPSFNIYKLEGVSKPGREVPFRSAGGHIHFGCGQLDPTLDEKRITNIVKSLDAIIGVASVSLFEGIEDSRRRQMYGMAGEYRLPNHGLEYRSLSNAWLCHPLAMNITFDLARQAFAFGDKGYNLMWKATEKEIVDCIQFCDVKLARKILTRNKDLLLLFLSNVYKGIRPHVIQRVIMQGISSAVQDPSAIESNWQLDAKKHGVWTYHSDGPGKNVQSASIRLHRKKKVS